MLCLLLLLLLLEQNSLDAALRLPALLRLLPCLSYKCQSAVAAAAAAPTSPTRHPCPSASLSVRQSKNAVWLGSSSNQGRGRWWWTLHCIAWGEAGGCCKLEELGIGTGLLLLGGRNWLPAVLNYKRSLFSDFVCNTFNFFLFTAWIAILLLLLLFCFLISVDKFCGNQRHKRKNNLAKLPLN